jgi:hypothetical protein
MFAVRRDYRGVREAIWLALMALVAAAIMLIFGRELAGAAEFQARVPPTESAAQ